jgi:hypothetical protein
MCFHFVIYFDEYVCTSAPVCTGILNMVRQKNLSSICTGFPFTFSCPVFHFWFFWFIAHLS